MIHSWKETAPDRSDQGEDEDTEANGLPQGREAGMLMHHDQRVSAGWGVNRFGCEHENECQDHRKDIYPESVTKCLGAKHANERPTQMSAEQCPRLGRRCPCKPKEEHRGTADRGQQERRGRHVHKPKGDADACCRPNCTPNQTPEVSGVEVDFPQLTRFICHEFEPFALND